jgi:DNA helicase-2/ATP-dependent DNA helicase PcrA
LATKTNSDPHWLKSDLNVVQKKAVAETEGPVLILAGAGSGKTRVLTYRIAYLLANGLAEPKELLAMTFTNKAAAEMRERVAGLIPNRMSGMWIGTFHSLFARLLRQEGERLGFTKSFSIYDQDDQVTLIKTILKDFKLKQQDIPPRAVAHKISAAKNAMLTFEQLEQKQNNYLDVHLPAIFREYQRRLREMDAMDFDDLLLKPIELFERFPLVLDYYSDKFRYILVDEYQDTNRAQYVVLKYLASKHRNICVVGDDDQSIYRWRGAEIKNILDFEKDYPECKKFHLEQNYRSTQNILAAAHSVVKNNHQRHPKKLWTEKEKGNKVILIQVDTELEESKMVVDRIGYELKNGGYNFSNFAVLYRTNAQSRVPEEALRAESIPYIIVGGVKFYERKEIKDVLAYLRVLCNPSDAISLRRIINFPTRGIGGVTFGKIEAYAKKNTLSLLDALKNIDNIDTIQQNARQSIKRFYKMLNKYSQLKDDLLPAELASSLIEELGIIRIYKEEGTIESLTRIDNIRELLVAIAEFSKQQDKPLTLEGFLENVSLTTDIDNWDDQGNAVTLMTLHSAKGLEFSVVFIVGLEEGLFPLSRSSADPMELEEERRLFYVGATRAMNCLYLSWARSRRRYGGNNRSYTSRFIKELDASFIDVIHVGRKSIPQRRTYLPEPEDHTMPDYENESQEQTELRIGMRVEHQTFGKGTILQIDPSSHHPKLVVLFDDAGKRRLVLPYAKLEIL